MIEQDEHDPLTDPGVEPAGTADRGVLFNALVILIPAAIVAALVAGGSRVLPSADADEHLARGIAAHRAGRIEEARSAYVEAFRADPRNKFAIFNLALIAEQNDKDLRRAELNYRAAIGIDPSFVPALLNLAVLRDRAQDSISAEQLYRRVISLDAGNARARLNLGLLLRRAGRTDEGDAEIRRAEELQPGIRDSRGSPTQTP